MRDALEKGLITVRVSGAYMDAAETGSPTPDGE